MALSSKVNGRVFFGGSSVKIYVVFVQWFDSAAFDIIDLEC